MGAKEYNYGLQNMLFCLGINFNWHNSKWPPENQVSAVSPVMVDLETGMWYKKYVLGDKEFN